MVVAKLRMIDWLAPTVASALFAFGLSFVHWALFNTMPDAVSAMQTFHALVRDGFSGVNSLEQVPVFSVHLWFAGLVALPFFKVAPSYLTLVGVQAVILSASVPAAGRLALHLGKTKEQSLRWMWIWAVNPLVIGSHCGWGEGWQPLILAIPGLMWALEFAMRGSWTGVWMCATWAILAREDASLVVFGLGLWLVFARNGKWHGIAMAVVSAGWFLFSTQYLLPTWSNGDWNVLEKAWPSMENGHRSVYSQLVAAPWTLLRNAIQPASFVAAGFLYVVWGRFGRKATIHLLPVVLWFALMLIVEAWVSRNPFLHYLAPSYPFLFLAALSDPACERRILSGLFIGFAGFFVWEGRLLQNAWKGADLRGLACLEESLPRTASMAIYSPRGATRFAWGQDLRWLDSASTGQQVVVVEDSRKNPGWWSSTELAGFETSVAASGGHLVMDRPGLRAWTTLPLAPVPCK